MVVKTETCAFSEQRVYPGHGIRYIRRDGSSYVLLNSKCKSLFLQRKKPTKLTWTLGWRRMNKKIKVEEVSKRRSRKSTKIQRAILGVSAAEITKKRNQKPEVRAIARASALKEAKSRSKTKKSGKAAGGIAKGAAASKNMPRGAKKTGNRGKM